MNLQKGNLYLIIAIIVGVVAIGAVGFASWKYFGKVSELEKEKSQPSYLPEQEKNIPQIEEQEEIIPSKKSDETADWKNYENTKYGFEIKYPKEAEYFKPKTEGIVFIGKNPTSGFGYGITTDVIKNSQNLSAENWYAQYYESEKEESKDLPFFLSLKGKYAKLNIYSAYKTSDFGIDHTDIYYFISRNNYIYKIHYNEEKANDPNWNQHEKIINQMLSTFKFTEANETLNWKSYLNEKYKYSIRYPANLDFIEDWQITEKTSNPDDNVAFVSKNPYEGGVEIIVKDKSYNMPLKDWLVKNDIYGNIISLEEINFNGLKSCKTHSKEPVNINTERIYFEKNSNLYQISFIGKGSDNREFEKISTYSLFQEILSTFKFTEQF